MNRKIRVLFCNPPSSSFIKTDFEILKKHFDVRIPEFGMSFGVRTFLRQPFHYANGFSKNRCIKFPPLSLVKNIVWADLTFSWFAQPSAYSAVILSKIFRKKSVVVVGGYDVVNIPEIEYGQMLDPRRARKVEFILENADKVLPFSDYAERAVLNITRNTHIDTIPLASDTEKFKPGKGEKENIILTVCHVKKENIARKGLETFIESASLLPEIKFVLIGAYMDDSINYLRKVSPSNVEFTGYVSEEELVKWYQRAKVYCQLSYQEGEGAGGALGEAMACECIPVISSKAVALRETVGDCGIYVPHGDEKATVEAIKKALYAPLDLGARARKRMKDLFSMEKREKKLLKTINDVLSTHA